MKRSHLLASIIAPILVVLVSGCLPSDSQPGADAPAATRVVLQATRVPALPSADQATPLALPAIGQVELDAEERLLAEIYDRVAPAVVRIDIPQRGLGSGFLIDTQGHIVTNFHVVQPSSDGQVLVSFTGLFTVLGQVIGVDPDSDLAVVKVDQLPEGVQPIELGNSSSLRVGQRTVAIGNPLGQDRTLTTGIISAIGRTIDEGGQYSIGGAIQTDAAINPGNSGGPLLDSAGRVIGVNTAILSPVASQTGQGQSSGIGFAIPVDLVRKVAPALIERGEYEHPYLGVSLRTVNTYEAAQNNLPTAGVLMEPSGRDTPVVRAGLRETVILLAMDGQSITSTEALIAYLELNKSPGDIVRLTMVSLSGEQFELDVEVGARPRSEGNQ